MLLNAASVPGQRTLISAASELFLSYFKLAARDIGVSERLLPGSKPTAGRERTAALSWFSGSVGLM